VTRAEQDPNRNSAKIAADALRQSAYAASGLRQRKTKCSETKREYATNYRKPPLHTRFKNGQSGNPRGRPKKTLPALLLAAPVLTIDGKRRKITKREVIVTQMINNAAGADLCATKMLIDMMKDIERKAGVAAPPEPHRFAPADEQVIKHMLERIRGELLQEIQEMNSGNLALAMISLPPACPDRRANQATSPADVAV
jgi:hypothetical protein